MSDQQPPESSPTPPWVEGPPALWKPAPASAPPPPLRVAPTWRAYLLCVVTFGLSLFTSTTLGAGWYLSTRTDVTTDLLPLLTGETIVRVWTDPTLLRIGLAFSLPLLFILLCHELGHYLVCRRYRIPATLPFFLPAPLGLGTFGAFIRIKAPIRSKRELLDVGAGGPIAGFVALLPFLIYGVAHSTPAVIHRVPAATTPVSLLVPGANLALDAVTRLFHGPLPENGVLDLHPFALAAWIGLFATALNLLPVGQLDGGHILYAVLGPRLRRAAPLLWVLLLAAGFLWPGWWFWCVLLLVMGLRHPPVANEREPLDRRRLAIAALCLLLLVLCLSPVPFEEVPVAP